MKIRCGKCGRVSEAKELAAMARYECSLCGAVNEVLNVELKEWLNFNYNEFLSSIETFIEQDSFSALRASNELEEIAGKLTDRQIEQLRNILIVSFNEGLSIREITKKIEKEIKIKDLKEISDGKVTDRILAYAEQRPLSIARTESTRVAAEGTLLNYKENDIKEVSYLSSVGERTCDKCNSLNGKILSINEAKGLIPVHPYCRCTFIPVVKT